MANVLCRQHPLTADHVSKLGALVDEKIGTLIGDAALKNKVADLAPWYELRGVIAQMQSSSTDNEKVKPEPKTRAPRAQKPQPSAPHEPEPSGGDVVRNED